MNIKKVAALILVVALAVVLCVSCAKKEETKGEVTFRIKNQLLNNIAILTLREKDSSAKQVWNTTNMVPGQEIEMTVTTVMNNDAPNLELKLTTEFGEEYTAAINEKGNVKTIVVEADPQDPNKVIAEISNE